VGDKDVNSRLGEDTRVENVTFCFVRHPKGTLDPRHREPQMCTPSMLTHSLTKRVALLRRFRHISTS
jgi:hypothetical protein